MYCFLVESTTMENTTFRYKTALSKANAKTNRMGTQNGLIKVSGVFPLTT